MNSALTPQALPTVMLRLEELLAGVIILAPSPMAPDSPMEIALANPAAAILRGKDIVSREVFEQAL
jgi:hypothetical protein